MIYLQFFLKKCENATVVQSVAMEEIIIEQSCDDLFKIPQNFLSNHKELFFLFI